MCRKLFIVASVVLVLGLVSQASAQVGKGYILFEYWMNIGGTAVSDLTGQADYPDNPDDAEWRNKYEGPVDWTDNYGSRARGYLYPPEDGDYTFWISGDDYEELYLSTDDDPANVALIAEVPGWTEHLEWGKYPEQQSAPVTLVGGQTYYIESIMKEGGGGDSMTVAWAGPTIGDELTIIDGAYLSPLIRADDPLPAFYAVAQFPDPADGAIEVDQGTLGWTPGITAVSHVVYLSEDATIDAADLAGETDMNILAVDLAPGVTYYWRVDEVEADGAVVEGNVWTFDTMPLEAHFPVPADGATNIESGVVLTWTPGKVVVMHDIYFGTDEAAVAAGDPTTFKGKMMVASYDPGPLELFTTYYWRVDEFTPTGTIPGPVWSFSTPNAIVVLSGETTLAYDNSAEPYVTEAAFDVPADLTAGGIVSDVTLTFQGLPANLSIDEATGTYEVSGSGADVWGSSDQFHYVYKELTGDGTITAQVISNGTGSNAWAKGGVMIRESTAPGTKHAIMALTGGEGGGITFQGRWADGDRSMSMHGDITAEPPHWVRLVREGNNISAYHSADGEAWELFTDTATDGTITNPQVVEMPETVLIGLFVTSHAAGEIRTYTMDNVSIEGDVSADLVSKDIDSVSGNSAEPIYVAIEDSAGAVAMVTHPYPAATQIESARDWTIPLSAFAGADTTAAAKLSVGVGDGTPGGAGEVTLSNILVIEPVGPADIIWVGDGYDDNGDGAADDLEWIDILQAEGYTVDYQINALGNGYWRTLDDDKIAALNAAGVIIISRNSNSGDYNNDDEGSQWNSITTPIINSSTHLVRSSRWKWFDSTSILSLTPAVMDVLVCDDPLCAGVPLQVSGIDAAVGTTSFIDADPGNGTVLATGDGLPWIIEWEAGVEFYDGAGEIAGGPRMFFAAGTQEDTATGVGRGEMNLAPGALAVFLNAVAKYMPLSDITVPGDKVVGVPDDGDWPGAEHPALAIDDNTGTKYLHFKGDFNPDPGTGGTGIRITPYEGASIVTGLTFTTANDAAPRDPAAYALSGSNVGIGGPYTLIAEGDIVDFVQADAWPRFTKNETPIVFDNDVAYAHYQIIITAIRDAPNANSMQVAEIELLGSR